MKPEKYNSIFGWFGFEKIYDMLYDLTPEGGKIVEVGCFMGKSTAYMAELIAQGDKNITFYAVDHFKGSDEQIHREMLKDVSLEDVYFDNIARAGLSEVVITLVQDSKMSASKFEDDSLDAIFIDAGHHFDEVMSDLTVWFPKLKIGGVIAGHDYYGSHQEVKQAVDKFFPIFSPVKSDVPTECWWYEKPS